MPMHVTLRQLQAFATVVDTSSFTDAARSMHLSQAALSGLIKELEERVGVRLLDRSTRRVVPSAVGHAFVPLVRRVLEDLDDALESLANIKELRRGLVRVASPEPLSCTLLPELIAAYGRCHPDVEVRFEDVPIEQVRSGLENGNIDVGFGPSASFDDPMIARQELWSDPLWIALRADDPLAERTSIQWKDVRGRAMLTFMRSFDANVLSRVPARAQPRELVRVHRINTALSMLKVRDASVVAPSMARGLIEGYGLAFRPLTHPVVRRGVSVFVRKRQSLSPAVDSFLQFGLAYARSWFGSRVEGHSARPAR